MRGFAMLTELLTAPALRSSALQLHLCREAASFNFSTSGFTAAFTSSSEKSGASAAPR